MVDRQRSVPIYSFGVWKQFSLHQRSPAHAYDQGRRIPRPGWRVKPVIRRPGWFENVRRTSYTSVPQARMARKRWQDQPRRYFKSRARKLGSTRRA
eukprot:4936265-Lingulodinium_polyedra.AAC.1